MHISNTYRLLLSLRAKTNLSATSFVSLLPSTVPFATTRTKPARTAVRSVIASTTARRNRTLRPASSAASVVKLVTWLAIVQTAKLDSPGATTTASPTAVSQLVSLLRRTSSTLSWPRWEVPLDSPVRRSSTTATALLVETATVEASALSSPGSVVLLEVLHPGRATMATTVVAVTATLLLLPLGLAAAAVAVSLTTKATVLVTVRLLGLLLLPLRLRQVLVTDTVVMVTTRTLAWALLAHTVLLAMALLHLPPVLLRAWVLSSRAMAVLVALLRLPRRPLDLCLHHLLQARRLLLPRLATLPHHRHHLLLRWTCRSYSVDSGSRTACFRVCARMVSSY